MMISRGGEEANRNKISELGLTFPVVLQRHWEISRAYGMFATPIAFLVDANGVIVSDVAVGGEPILQLADSAGGRGRAAPGFGPVLKGTGTCPAANEMKS